MKHAAQKIFRLRPSAMTMDRRLTVTLITLFFLSVCALAWFLYQNIVRSVLLPREIDPSLVTAKQEKVNRILLDAILKNDTAKHAPVTSSPSNNPFGP